MKLEMGEGEVVYRLQQNWCNVEHISLYIIYNGANMVHLLIKGNGTVCGDVDGFCFRWKTAACEICLAGVGHGAATRRAQAL